MLTSSRRATIVEGGDIPGLDEEVALIVSGSDVWVFTSSGWAGPLSIAETFCPGSSTDCPTDVDSVARIPGPSLVVRSGTSSHTATLGAGALAWSSFEMSDVPCGP